MTTTRGLSIDLKGEFDKWDKYAKRFKKNIELASRAAVALAVQHALYEIDTRLRDKKYEKLATLTRLGRSMSGHSNTPLIRTGGLRRSISTEVLDAFTGVVGVNRQQGFNLALLLHEGGSIPITDAMRRSFMRKFSGLKKRSTGKTHIRIPPRRFIADVFDDSKFEQDIRRIFLKQLQIKLKL